MAEMSSPTPSGATVGKSPEPPAAVPRFFTGVRLRAALVLVALSASFVAAAIFFQLTGRSQGYRSGYRSVGYPEAQPIADSMKAAASQELLKLAGLVPDAGQLGVWHVARFELARPSALYRYGTEPDTTRVPAFSSLEKAPVNRSYHSGSDGRIHYVDRKR